MAPKKPVNRDRLNSADDFRAQVHLNKYSYSFGYGLLHSFLGDARAGELRDSVAPALENIINFVLQEKFRDPEFNRFVGKWLDANVEDDTTADAMAWFSRLGWRQPLPGFD